MYKMKQMIARIEDLETIAAKLLKVVEIDSPVSLDINLSSRSTSAYFSTKINPEEIKPFVQARLDLVLAELTPLKERMKLLTELLDGVKV